MNVLKLIRDALPPTSENFEYQRPLLAKKFERQCEQIISMVLPITETSLITLSFIWYVSCALPILNCF